MAHAHPSPAHVARTDPAAVGSPLAPFSFDELVERIRAEFIEQPGLQLTEAQGCRLWQIDRPTAQLVLSTLTDAGFLSSNAHGRFTRRSTV